MDPISNKPETTRTRLRCIHPALTAVILGVVCSFGCRDTTELPKEASVHIGDITGVRQKHFQYLKGNIIDCRNVTVDVLVGDVRGKSKNVYVNSMKGNIEADRVTVNVLEGNILGGSGIAVNVHVSGLDMTGRARIMKRIDSTEKTR